MYVDPSGHTPNYYYTPFHLRIIDDAEEYSEGWQEGTIESGKIGIETALDIIADGYALFAGKTIFGEKQNRLLSLAFIVLPELIEQGGKLGAKIAPDLAKVIEGAGKGLSGTNWKFNKRVDVDFRGTGLNYQDALNVAFERTGIPKDQFEVTKWGKDITGKTVPVEWQGPNGANVNMDIPEWNNVKPNGDLGNGPHQPHIGYQTPGKGADRIRGHIFTDYIPATRR